MQSSHCCRSAIRQALIRALAAGVVLLGATAQPNPILAQDQPKSPAPAVSPQISPPQHDSNRADPPAAGFSSRVTSTTAATTPATSSLPEAPRTELHIQPGQSAPLLTPGDKVRMGFHSTFSLFPAVGWFAAAGYEQITNGSPNYGTDRGAFGRRLGDAAIRATTEDLLSESAMAPLLHEDPRYYRLGPAHNLVARALYAATRPLITRTDDGRPTPNFALMGGNLAGSVLTNAYYPQVNRNGKQTVETFADSLAGSAFGDLITEFLGGFLFKSHLTQ